jgi:hypothetical protein
MRGIPGNNHMQLRKCPAKRTLWSQASPCRKVCETKLKGKKGDGACLSSQKWQEA